MTHTPGPWAVSSRNQHGDLYVGPVDGYVAIVVARPVLGPTETNAQLIAAAPDLLAALKNITAEYNSGTNSFAVSASRLYKIVCDAITQAEGKSNNN